MEFACGFVYVSPATQVKRSALLPPRTGRYLHSALTTTPKPGSALLPPKKAKPVKALKPPAHPPPIPTTPKPTPPTSASPTKPTPVYENLLQETQYKPNPHTVTSPPPDWRKHLGHAWSPPLPAPKPIRKPQTPSESDSFYELPSLELEEESSDVKHWKPPVSPQSYQRSQTPAAAPPPPPRPSFFKRLPEYGCVLPSSSSPSGRDRLSGSSSSASEGDDNKQPLPGNPNVLLVNLGRLVGEEQGECMQGEPSCCLACGSVFESTYDNMVKECYFCQSWSSAPSPAPGAPTGCEDLLFLLTPDHKGQSADGNLLIFCICTSRSMSTQVEVESKATCRSRLHSVQVAMLQCVQTLGERDPELRIGLVTFDDKVTMHSVGELPSQILQGGELSDKDYLKEAGLSFPTPPPLSQSQASLQMEIHKLQGSGASTLGAAALVSISMASKHPGSKVLVCTDGVPNAGLGNLDPELSRSIVSSSIFYQELGETAATQGVSVSVVSVEGSGCRLDELGRLTDGTGGKVLISSCDDLYVEFMGLIDDRTIATHTTVTLLLPSALRLRGEKEAGHCGMREVGNITEKSKITFQYGETEKTHALLSGRSVCVQLQVRYRRWDGLSMLRVLTANLKTTEDSSQVLPRLCLSILLLNASQTSAALALRGRFRDAQRERDAQKQLVHRGLEHRQNTEDELIWREWIRATDSVYNSLRQYTHKTPAVRSACQSLSDTDAALLYAMKNNYYDC
ncbi:circularly permutated Ras protein 1-like isoform X2 [Pygocentrus nattereri]|uniref:circularly permutated Ras protein 1-like isoform X2 n=1 Tax=Pygocentrus nattereri TaxID=42514 RepID=UPI001891E092|nr:circularly permutated Ras protein 1-like isoform X2 [Pygocentrus nattereri]